MLCVTAQDYESRLEALQKQVESYLPGSPEAPGAEGSVNSGMFYETVSGFPLMWPWLHSMEEEGPGAGFMGLPQVELLPVYVSSSSSLGERHLPEGGQRSECTTPQEGGCSCQFHTCDSTATPDECSALVGAVSLPAADRHALLAAAFTPVSLRGGPGQTAATHHCGCGGAGSDNRGQPSLDAGQAEVLVHGSAHYTADLAQNKHPGPSWSGCGFLEPWLLVAGRGCVS